MNPANFKELAEQIAISVRHLRYLLEQIEFYIPKATVWAFGSRIKWSHRPESDLDLAVHCDKETARKALPKLNYALDESNLPFKVQIADFNRLPANMQANIKKNYLVIYQPQKNILPSGWKETTLEEVIYPVSETFDFTGKDVVHFLNTGDILDGKLLHNDFVKVETLPGQAKKSFLLGDILYSEIRPANKRYMLVDFDSSNSVASTKLMVLRTKDGVDKQFIYQILTSKDTLKEFQFIAESRSGTFPQITFEAISFFPILLPPLAEQKAIAAILSSFDDKIELLRRQNKTLEQIAQTIFKEWFVNFTVNGKKLKLNSKTSLPEGWRLVALPDVFEINPVRKLKRGELAPYLDMKGVPTQGHRAEGWYNREFIAGSKFANGDTLLAKITPCLENGKTAFVDFLDDKETGWGSTEFIVLRPKTPLPPFYGYLLARSEAFRSFAIGQMTGSSGRQRVPEDSLSNYEVVIPSDDVVIRFGELIEPIAQRLTINGKESQTLSKLRDALLPKLMKGEIKVKL